MCMAWHYKNSKTTTIQPPFFTHGFLIRGVCVRNQDSKTSHWFKFQQLFSPPLMLWGRQHPYLSLFILYARGSQECRPQTRINKLLGPIQIHQVGISLLISSLAGLPDKIQDSEVWNSSLWWISTKNICSDWYTLIFKFHGTSWVFFFSFWLVVFLNLATCLPGYCNHVWGLA